VAVLNRFRLEMELKIHGRIGRAAWAGYGGRIAAD
jgi:hypothetical protein